ncbi:hypothetical protein [Mesorhizobium helmanticense]|uniref:Uncharacterized protein n=1 Tax=Mesorhizobium helmanticense TaxID=1776423 RepID=A0A2T4IS69_9HYPH|nr:hypothetical protein [Mesorhizobium helmanticense]PTE08512.1 hypothetical protein C9427_21335 [Mesorhizobium helmanticense]
MRKWAPSLLVMIILSWQAARAADQGSQSLAKVFHKLDQAIDSAELSHEQYLGDLKRLRIKLAGLEVRLNKISVGLPLEYSAGFNVYEDILESRPLNSALIQQVETDIEAKTQFFVKSAGFFPFSRSLLVLVSVSTYEKDTAAPGYGVVFNPVSDADKKYAKFPFGSETNTASRQLPPGNYILRLYRGEDAVMTKIVAVGFQGTDSEEVRIDISAVGAHVDTQHN